MEDEEKKNNKKNKKDHPKDILGCDFSQWVLKDEEAILSNQKKFSERIIKLAKQKSFKVKCTENFIFSNIGLVFFIDNFRLKMLNHDKSSTTMLHLHIERFNIICHKNRGQPCDCSFQTLRDQFHEALPIQFCLNHELIVCWNRDYIIFINMNNNKYTTIDHSISKSIFFIERLLDDTLIIICGDGEILHCVIRPYFSIIKTFQYQVHESCFENIISGPSFISVICDANGKKKMYMFPKSFGLNSDDYFSSKTIKHIKVEGKVYFSENYGRIYEANKKQLKIYDLGTLRLNSLLHFEFKIQNMSLHPEGKYVYLSYNDKRFGNLTFLVVYDENVTQQYYRIRLSRIDAFYLDQFDNFLTFRTSGIWTLVQLKTHQFTKLEYDKEIFDRESKVHEPKVKINKMFKEFLQRLALQTILPTKAQFLLMKYVNDYLMTKTSRTFVNIDTILSGGNAPIERFSNIITIGDYSLNYSRLFCIFKKPKSSPFFFYFSGFDDLAPRIVPTKTNLNDFVCNADGTKVISLDSLSSATVINVDLNERMYVLKEKVKQVKCSSNKVAFYLLLESGIVEIYDFETLHLFQIVDMPDFLHAQEYFILYSPVLYVLQITQNDEIYQMTFNNEITYLEKKFLIFNFDKILTVAGDIVLFAYENSYTTYFMKSLFLRRYFHPMFIAVFLRKIDMIKWVVGDKSLSSFNETSHQFLSICVAIMRKDQKIAQICSNFMLKSKKKLHVSQDQMSILLQSLSPQASQIIEHLIVEQVSADGSGYLFPSACNIPNGISVIIRPEKYFNRSTLFILEHIKYKDLTDQELKQHYFHTFEIFRQDRSYTNPMTSVSGDTLNQSINETNSLTNRNSEINILTQEGVISNRSPTLILLEELEKKPFISDMAGDKLNLSEKKVLLLRINCNTDLRIGTQGSLKFLFRYVATNEVSLVFSNWRYIILYKWRKLRWISYISSFFHFVESILITIYFRYPDRLGLFITLVVFASFLFINRSLLVISFMINKINYVIELISTILVLYMLFVIVFSYEMTTRVKDYDVLLVSSFQLSCLIYSYLKLFWNLQVLERLRHLIVMWTWVAWEIADVIFILTILAFLISFMYGNNNQDLPYLEVISFAFFAIFGGIPNDAPLIHSYLDAIVLVFAAIVLPLITVNFIIAKMASKYAELEKLGKVLNLKSKAYTVIEFENLYSKYSQMFKLKNVCTANPENDKNKNKGAFFTFLAVNPDDFQDYKHEIDDEDIVENTHSLKTNEEKEQEFHQSEMDMLKNISLSIERLSNKIDGLIPDNLSLMSGVSNAQISE